MEEELDSNVNLSGSLRCLRCLRSAAGEGNAGYLSGQFDYTFCLISLPVIFIGL